MDDLPSDTDEKEPVYESDKQSERNVESPSVASVSSKILPPETRSVRGHAGGAMAAFQNLNSAKSRQSREEFVGAQYSDYLEQKVWDDARMSTKI